MSLLLFFNGTSPGQYRTSNSRGTTKLTRSRTTKIIKVNHLVMFRGRTAKMAKYEWRLYTRSRTTVTARHGTVGSRVYRPPTTRSRRQQAVIWMT